MKPETLLAEMENSSNDTSTLLATANQAFQSLVGMSIPIQYGLNPDGKRPIIIDTDNIEVLARDATLERLNHTYEDYKQRILKHRNTFNSFVKDGCSRSSSAMQQIMLIEIGWAFFYWCYLSRIRDESRVPPNLVLRINKNHFGGWRGSNGR